MIGNLTEDASVPGLEVDEPVGVLVPLPFEHSAGVRQAAYFVHKAVVVGVIDKEGRIRNERPRETGAGNVYVFRRGGGGTRWAGSLESDSGRSDGCGGTG